MFQNVPVSHTTQFEGQTLSLETGLLANQATASVLASIGQTTVLAAVVVGQPVDRDFFPLQVIYEERMYASGKIKGSRFQKREGRPSETAILTGRMIDRSLRSLFDKHIRQEIQVIITVLSIDEVNPPDTLSVLAASSALCLAGIRIEDGWLPGFSGPVSSVRIGELARSLGEVILPQVQTLVDNAPDFESMRPALQEIAGLLDGDNSMDQPFIREVFAILGRKNSQWAADYRNIFNRTKPLTQSQIQQQYKLEPEFMVNPSYEAQENSILDLVVSGNGGNIAMLEAGSRIITEEHYGLALDLACRKLSELTQIQTDFIAKCEQAGRLKSTSVTANYPSQVSAGFWSDQESKLEDLLYSAITKDERGQYLKEFKNPQKELINAIIRVWQNDWGIAQLNGDHLMPIVQEHDPLLAENSDIPAVLGYLRSALADSRNIKQDLEQILKDFDLAFDDLMDSTIKRNILLKERRLDGRALDQLRQITCQVGVLPHTHGSSLFQRGETQVLNVLTLGTNRDAQTLDDMEDFEETTKRYFHHYNFPPYSVGETGRYIGPGRREIGHGALAEKALLPVLPSEEKFPYTMRLVSECLGSNGSTSMASTCASTLSLMDGGVPIKDLVAGIAMGLVLNQETRDFKLLTDILGAEDHHGDMDFKVTGTRDGITAIQLDNKVAGLTPEILKQALIRSKDARLQILDIMRAAISEPRKEISKYAPRVLTFTIPADRIGDVIGPSGKIIKAIIQQFEVEIDIEDNTGKTFVYGRDMAKAEAAADYINKLIKEYVAGEVVDAQIFRIEAYGAFAKIDGTDKEGLIHISELANRRVGKVTDVVQMGQTVQAKIIEVNEKGQISLSIKRLENDVSKSEEKSKLSQPEISVE